MTEALSFLSRRMRHTMPKALVFVLLGFASCSKQTVVTVINGSPVVVSNISLMGALSAEIPVSNLQPKARWEFKSRRGNMQIAYRVRFEVAGKEITTDDFGYGSGQRQVEVTIGTNETVSGRELRNFVWRRF